jgi:hypothetical protein
MMVLHMTNFSLIAICIIFINNLLRLYILVIIRIYLMKLVNKIIWSFTFSIIQISLVILWGSLYERMKFSLWNRRRRLKFVLICILVEIVKLMDRGRWLMLWSLVIYLIWIIICVWLFVHIATKWRAIYISKVVSPFNTIFIPLWWHWKWAR